MLCGHSYLGLGEKGGHVFVLKYVLFGEDCKYLQQFFFPFLLQFSCQVKTNVSSSKVKTLVKTCSQY